MKLFWGQNAICIPRPTPRLCSALGWRRERDAGGARRSPPQKAGVGKKPALQDLGIPGTPAENSGFGGP